MKKQILLVAHEHDILDSFPVTLTLAGHDVLLANGGLQGIKQARNASPDVIVLDATLPDMDGSTIREILQRLPSTASIPTLLLKPRPHRLMPLALQADGIRAGLIQPLNSTDLLRQVRDALTLCQCRDLQLAEEMAEEFPSVRPPSRFLSRQSSQCQL
jgi:response regulator RpfG family c-di-GMP phosphodiesterase